MPSVHHPQQSNMVKYAFLVIAMVAVGALAAPKKQQQQQQQQKAQEFLEQVDAVRKDVEESIKKALPNEQEVTNTLITVSKNFASALETGVKNLNEHAEKNKEVFNNVVADISKGITDSLNFLQGLAGDDVGKKGQEVKKVIQTHVDNVLAGGKKIHDAVQPHWEQAQSQVKTLADTFFQDLAAAGERLKADIDKAVQNKKSKN